MDIELNETQLDSVTSLSNTLDSSLKSLDNAINQISSSEVDTSSWSSNVRTMQNVKESFDKKIEKAKGVLSEMTGHMFDNWVEVDPKAPLVWSSWFGPESTTGEHIEKWLKAGNKTLFGEVVPEDKLGSKDKLNTWAKKKAESHGWKKWDYKGRQSKKLQDYVEKKRATAPKNKRGNTQNKGWGKVHYDPDYMVGENYLLKDINIIDKRWELRNKDGKPYSLKTWGDGEDHEHKWGKTSGQIRLGAVDAAATCQVGVDHIVLGAEASVSGFQAKGAYKSPKWNVAGVDIVSAGVSGQVDALHAEASGKIAAGYYYDKKKGKWVTEVGAQFNAEADVFKATAEGYVDCLGVKGKVSGSIKFGAGVKANVGYVDGEIKCNLGFAVGLGFEIGFSLDVSNTVTTAKQVWNAVSGWFKGSNDVDTGGGGGHS